MTSTTPSDSEKLEPCPFCGQNLYLRKGVNAYGRCDTPGCYINARALVVPLDDPRQVSAWNTRAPDSDRQQGGVDRDALIRILDDTVVIEPSWGDHQIDPSSLEEAADKILAALTTQPAPVDASAAKPVAWRWKDWWPTEVPMSEKHWNYDDDGADRFGDGKECLWEPLYAAPDSGSLSPASGWRGIETAPKDGTEILIYRDGWQEAPRAKWGDHDGEDENDKPTVFGGWFLASEWHTYGCEDGFLGWNEDIADGVMPTVWMPLPPAYSKEPGK